MSQQKLVDIPFFDLSIENRKRLVFCIDFFNARVPEERKHKCEYIGKESPHIVKREWEKRISVCGTDCFMEQSVFYALHGFCLPGE